MPEHKWVTKVQQARYLLDDLAREVEDQDALNALRAASELVDYAIVASLGDWVSKIDSVEIRRSMARRFTNEYATVVELLYPGTRGHNE